MQSSQKNKGIKFVNLSGGQDKNLDGDYVMELMNKYAKGRVKLLGPNQNTRSGRQNR